MLLSVCFVQLKCFWRVCNHHGTIREPDIKHFLHLVVHVQKCIIFIRSSQLGASLWRFRALAVVHRQVFNMHRDSRGCGFESSKSRLLLAFPTYHQNAVLVVGSSSLTELHLYLKCKS